MSEQKTTNLYSKDEIVEKLQDKYGKERVHIISTEGYNLHPNFKRTRNTSKTRWADKVVKIITGKERKDLGCVYNFSYIKFAQSIKDEKKIYGIVGAKSSFHATYPSDVYFYDERCKKKKTVLNYMKEHKYEWYTKEILILESTCWWNKSKAESDEKEMQNMFNLFN